MKTIIAGTRDATLSETRVAIILCPWEITSVVSGLARGPDTHGVEYAKKNRLPVHTFPADWKKFGITAGYIRNRQMAQNAEALIAVWDGKSKGTKHMIAAASSHGIHLIHVYRTDLERVALDSKERGLGDHGYSEQIEKAKQSLETWPDWLAIKKRDKLFF